MFNTRFFNAVIAVALVGAAVFAATLIWQPAAVVGKAGAEGLTIYHASEQDRAAAHGLSAAGLAQYQTSERTHVDAAAGLAQYHASEQSRVAGRSELAAQYLARRNHIPAVRAGLFSMNAYQRSEWLGSDW